MMTREEELFLEISCLQIQIVNHRDTIERMAQERTRDRLEIEKLRKALKESIDWLDTMEMDSDDGETELNTATAKFREALK